MNRLISGEKLTAFWHRLTETEEASLGLRLLRGGLRLASLGYGCATGLRNWLYDRGWLSVTRVGVPVISVGNLTVGGTGKTPFVAWLLRQLEKLGLRMVVLSRGYGARHGLNDEGLELKQELPGVACWQGRNRAVLAQRAASEGAQVVVLDDGMQHRRLARDLEIVLVDAQDPWGGGQLLPLGRLREPPRALTRADAIVLTHSDSVSQEISAHLRNEIARLAPRALLAMARHRPRELTNAWQERIPLDALTGRKVVAFCGLAQPRAFRNTLRQVGAEIVAWRNFPDHYDYCDHDLHNLACWAARFEQAELVLTTRKDLVKIPRVELANKPLLALVVEMEIVQGEDELRRRIVEVLSRNLRHAP